MSTFYLRAEPSTYVQSNHPGFTSCRSPYLPVGVWHNLDGGFSCEYISLVFFDISSLPQSLIIESAIMNLHFASLPLRGNPPESINIQALGGRFQDCHTRWDNKPPTIPSTTTTIPIPHRLTSLRIDLTHIYFQSRR